MTRKTYRPIGLGLASLLLIAVAGCGAPTAQTPAPAPAPAKAQAPAGQTAQPAKQSFAGQTLVVASWGGVQKDIRYQLIGQAVEKETGAKVEFLAGNPPEFIAKILAARGGEPPMDVADMDGPNYRKASNAGLFQPIDVKKIPNSTQLPKELVRSDGVAYVSVETGFVYNEKKFKELGLPKPVKFDDLWDPKLAGRVSWPTLDSVMGAIALPALAVEKGGSVKNIQPAFDALKTLKPYYFYVTTADLATKFTANEVWAAVWIRTRVAPMKASGFPAAFSPVQVGAKKTMMAENWISVVKGSKKADLAHVYLNKALELDAQVGLGEKGTGRPVTPNGVAKLRASSNPELVALAESKEEEAFRPDWGEITTNLDQWIDTWNRTLSKK